MSFGKLCENRWCWRVLTIGPVRGSTQPYSIITNLQENWYKGPFTLRRSLHYKWIIIIWQNCFTNMYNWINFAPSYAPSYCDHQFCVHYSWRINTRWCRVRVTKRYSRSLSQVNVHGSRTSNAHLTTYGFCNFFNDYLFSFVHEILFAWREHKCLKFDIARTPICSL